MLLKITKYDYNFPNPSLREKCEEVKEITPELLELAKNMKETMLHKNGVGLAANQVGHKERLIIVDIRADQFPGVSIITMFNPKIVSEEGATIMNEGCLSFPGKKVSIIRYEKITVNFINTLGKPDSLSLEGLPAIIVQHEIDHLNSKLIVDYIYVEL